MFVIVFIEIPRCLPIPVPARKTLHQLLQCDSYTERGIPFYFSRLHAWCLSCGAWGLEQCWRLMLAPLMSSRVQLSSFSETSGRSQTGFKAFKDFETPQFICGFNCYLSTLFFILFKEIKIRQKIGVWTCWIRIGNKHQIQDEIWVQLVWAFTQYLCNNVYRNVRKFPLRKFFLVCFTYDSLSSLL